MEREGSEESVEEAEEDRGAPGTGEGHHQPGTPAHAVRDHPSQPGRTSPGVAPQGSTARHILQAMALAGPTEPPRTQGHRLVPVRLHS